MKRSDQQDQTICDRFYFFFFCRNENLTLVYGQLPLHDFSVYIQKSYVRTVETWERNNSSRGSGEVATSDVMHGR